MEKKNITSLLQEVIDLFSHLTTVMLDWSEADTDLDIDEEFELEWGEVGHDLDTIIGDKENLTMLIDYLKAEYHAGHTIDPQIKELRQCLSRALTVSPGEKRPILCLGAEYFNWLKWIDQYYPPEQSKQEQNNEKPVKQDEDLTSCFLVQDDKKNELLKKLHSLIDGKKGKSVAIVIHLCVELGLMSKKPTFGVLKAEFGNIGNASGFNSYYGKYETSYTKEEKDGLKKHFEPFMKCI